MKDSSSIPHWRQVVRKIAIAPFLALIFFSQVHRAVYSQDLQVRTILLYLCDRSIPEVGPDKRIWAHRMESPQMQSVGWFRLRSGPLDLAVLFLGPQP